MSNLSDQNAARAVIASLANSGDKIVSYTGDNGEIEAVGYIDQEMDYAGTDGQTPLRRHVVSLLVEEVGEPRRGDRVTDEDGAVWTLLDHLPSADRRVTDWTVQRR